MKAPATETWLLATHGVDGGPGVASDHAQRLRARHPGLDLRLGCLRGEPELSRAAQRLDRNAIILPLLMARGFIYERMLEQIPERLHGRVAAPLGQHPGFLDLVEARARSLARARDWAIDGVHLLLVGHGTVRHDGSDRTIMDHAEKAPNWGFKSVTPAFLEAPPFLHDVVSGVIRLPSVAIGYFIDSGPHGVDDVEAAIKPLGNRVVYSGPIGTDPAINQLLAEPLRQRRLAFC